MNDQKMHGWIVVLCHLRPPHPEMGYFLGRERIVDDRAEAKIFETEEEAQKVAAYAWADVGTGWQIKPAAPRAPCTSEKAQTGIDRIAAERARQIAKEGWTPEHDDEHTDHSLAMAAALYATPSPIFTRDERAEGVTFFDPWPWDDSWDKRPRFTDTYRLMDADAQGRSVRIRCLEKAGALIAAEIDRLLRFPSGERSS